MTTIYEMGATDFNRPPIQVLFERLNASNSTFLDPKDWVLSHPVPSIDTPFNTTITALPIQTTYWSRGFNIDYNRAELSEQFSIGCEVRTGGAESAYAILDAINVAYGVVLTEEDIGDTSIEYPGSSKTSGPGSLELRARANSVFYIGTTTIRVNVTYEQCVAPYNDELTHYVVVDPGTGIQELRSYDAMGLPNLQYNHLDPALTTTFKVKKLFKDEESAELILLGEFDFIDQNANHTTAKMLRVDSKGFVTYSSNGSFFGSEYIDLQHVQASSQGRIYALDVNNEIGGTIHQTLYYNQDGSIGTGWNPVAPSKITAIAPYLDTVYIAYSDPVDTTKAYINRVLLTGEQDPAFTPVEVGSNTDQPLPFIISALNVNSLRVAGTISITDPDWLQTSRLVQENGMGAPVVSITHRGILESVFNQRHIFNTLSNVGLARNKLAITTKAIVYHAYAIDKVTSEYRNTLIAVNDSGRGSGLLPPSIADEVGQFTSILEISASARDDMVVGGNLKLPAGENAAGALVYDYAGNYAATLLLIPDVTMVAYTHHRFLGSMQL